VVAVRVLFLHALGKRVRHLIGVAVLVQRQWPRELAALCAVVHHVAQAHIELEPVVDLALEAYLAEEQKIETRVFTRRRQGALSLSSAHAWRIDWLHVADDGAFAQVEAKGQLL